MAEIKTLRIDSTEVKVKSSESVLPTEYDITDGKMYCDVINKATISTDDVTLTLEGLKDVTTSITDKRPEYHAILTVNKGITVTLDSVTDIKLSDDTDLEILDNNKIHNKSTDKNYKLELSIQNGLCFVFVWGGVAPFSGLTFTAVEAGSTISGEITGTLSNSINLQYSTDDGATWNTFLQGTSGTATTVALNNVDDKVYIKNNNDTLNEMVSDVMHFFKFTITGKVTASGNMNSMINNTKLKDYCYYNMFYGCTGLTSAPSLPSTELANNCYSNMFRGCTGLTSTPSLPAEVLKEGCYGGMFNGCIRLTSAPSLPATTLAEGCYGSMFSGCTNLKVRNSSTTGATLFFTCPSGIKPEDYCFRMFLGTTGSFTDYTPAAGESYYWYTE